MVKLDWERFVMDRLIERLEISNGDAQGIFECHYQVLEEQWEKGLTPNQATSILIDFDSNQ